jgi:predicted nicotinamide N-methyase
LPELVTQTVDLPRGEITLLQPQESAELPDDKEVDWAPMAPYWTVLWRSGVALAERVDEVDLTGRRVVEVGCGLALPSIAAARGGATVLATDGDSEALELVERNARLNGVELETLRAEWADPEELVARGPFDLVLASDVLYERPAVAELLRLIPRLAPEAWLADPGRPASPAFLDPATERWSIELERRGVVGIHRLRFNEAVESLE